MEWSGLDADSLSMSLKGAGCSPPTADPRRAGSVKHGSLGMTTQLRGCTKQRSMSYSRATVITERRLIDRHVYQSALVEVS